MQVLHRPSELAAQTGQVKSTKNHMSGKPTYRDLRRHFDARFTSRGKFLQLHVERFIIWNQAALSRNVDSGTVPVEHFCYDFGEYTVAEFNAHIVIQIVDSETG